MSELVFRTFVLIGLCFILKYGQILNKPRDFISRVPFFKDLFKCSLCLGVWIGCAFGIFWGNLVLWGLYSAAVCWISDHFIMLVAKIVKSP